VRVQIGTKLTELAKTLRKRSTDTENYLWLFLKNRQIEGIKFRRQEPLGRYIVDFVSYESNLVIEVDGGQHYFDKDKERDEWLKNQGYEVIRFWDNEVLKNKDAVLEVIREKLITPHPDPLPQGERNSSKK